jgi:bacteriochlorophyllide a dehydrogenase
MQTQAIVITAPNEIELREVALTPPASDDVVVSTAYTSISAGTERMLLAGRMPHPLLQFPVVPGYETVGRVVDRGANVPPEWDGRWVFVGGARCYADVNPAWGGQAATLHVDHRRVVALHNIEPRVGVLLALAATALHGVDLLDVRDGQRVLVLGQGPVGQIAARLLRGRGARVAVADRISSRLDRSEADQIVNVESQPLAEAIDGPFDAVVEATGSMAALMGALSHLANNGTLLLLGYYDKLDLPYMPLFLKQARLLTAREWAPGDLDRCATLIASRDLDLAPLLTHALPIEQFREAYNTALNDADCLKLVLEWN